MEIAVELERFFVLSDGWTTAPEGALIREGRWNKRLKLRATAFLLRHPEQGWILVDTGYSQRATTLKGTRGFIYRHLLPIHLSSHGGVKALVSSVGVDPEDVRHIVLTHLHPDHIGGLRDFPGAKIHLHPDALSLLENPRPALRHVIFPELIPEDFTSRASPASGDIFGDGSLYGLSLPGHATGQMGLLFSSDERPTLLAADSCWLSEGYLQNEPPPKLSSLIHDQSDYLQSLRKVHLMSTGFGGRLEVLPSHCPRTAEKICAC